MPRNKKKVIELRYARVAALTLSGVSQQDIAKQLGFTPAQISLDLKKLRKRWKEETERDINELQQRELRRIDAIELIAWEQFELSKLPTKTTRKTIKRERLNLFGDPEGEEGIANVEPTPTDDTELVVVEEVEQEIEKTTLTGDPRWIDKVQWCITQRCKILGLDSGFTGVVINNFNIEDLSVDQLKILSVIGDKIHSQVSKEQ